MSSFIDLIAGFTQKPIPVNVEGNASIGDASSNSPIYLNTDFKITGHISPMLLNVLIGSYTENVTTSSNDSNISNSVKNNTESSDKSKNPIVDALLKAITSSIKSSPQVQTPDIQDLKSSDEEDEGDEGDEDEEIDNAIKIMRSKRKIALNGDSDSINLKDNSSKNPTTLKMPEIFDAAKDLVLQFQPEENRQQTSDVYDIFGQLVSVIAGNSNTSSTDKVDNDTDKNSS